MTATIEIPGFAQGPDGSGNGGWSAGLLALHVRGTAASSGIVVNLRVPPPLDRPLRVSTDGDVTQLFDDEPIGDPVLVATAAAAQVDFDVPEHVRAITLEQATGAQSRFPFRDAHPFPRCVSCGTGRAPGSVALHLWAGTVDAATSFDAHGEPTPVLATSWHPGADVADVADPSRVSIAAIWSALDCPSATPIAAGATPGAPASVLARIAAVVDGPVLVDEPHIVAAWLLGVDGRKQRSASVLLDSHGTVLARAEALWIELKPA